MLGLVDPTEVAIVCYSPTNMVIRLLVPLELFGVRRVDKAINLRVVVVGVVAGGLGLV